MADRIWRDEFHDYMSDDEYQDRQAKMAAYKQANPINPAIQKLAESYKQSVPGEDPVDVINEQRKMKAATSPEEMDRQREIFKAAQGASSPQQFFEGGEVANTFKSMKPNYKESFTKKTRFKKVQSLIQPKGKATAELEASKDPMGFIKKTKNMKIPKKGFAF